MKQLLTLAVFLVSLSVFSQNEKIDSLMIQLAYQSKDSSKVGTSLILIKELYEIEDYKKALLFINETSKLSKDINYIKGIAESSYFRALIYTKQNDYYNAIDNYKKSRQSYLAISDTLGVAKVSNSIGLLEIKRGNYSVGLSNSLSAIAIFEKRNLKNELSEAYNNLAEAYFKTNQIDKALDFNFKALEVRKQTNDNSGIKVSNKNIADLYSLRKEHRKAIEYYEKTLELLNPDTDQDLRGEILPKLGSEYLQFNEYDKAANYLIEGLKYNRSRDNKEGILRALNAIGNLNLQKNKVRLAELQLNEAYQLAQQIDNKSELLENYRLHIQLDSTRGFYQNAFFWQNKYYDLKEAINRSNEPQLPTDVSPLDLNEVDPIEDIGLSAVNESSLPNWLNKPLVVYGIIAALLIALTLLIVSYLKRNSYKVVLAEQTEKL
ncbi:MAG: tetratricopeptide repeat protein, partial [Winogradskyella sp.]|uniref:tetratricopeptide repeat protein n=1 Tax=Winogradskyella sp. TaxID=1883156 RepID=UPI0018000E7B|nr:tetratricopeptide repeat protein [Winogradskyella sp.]